MPKAVCAVLSLSLLLPGLVVSGLVMPGVAVAQRPPTAVPQAGTGGDAPVRVETTNGRFWIGRIVSQSAQEVVVQTLDGPLTIARANIRQIGPANVARVAVTPAVVAPAVPVAGERLALAGRSGVLRLSGESALATQLLPALLADYGREAGLDALREDVAPNPTERVYVLQGAETARNLRAEVRMGGAARALAELAAGQSDVGMAGRRVSEAELRGLQAPGNARLAGQEQVIALGGVAVIVHRDNPVTTIALDRLRDVLTGAVTSWQGLGGPGAPLTVYALADDEDAQALVRERVLGPGARLAARVRRVDSHEDLADAVAGDPGGIGLVNLAQARNARALRVSTACGLVHAPSPFKLRSEEYPLAQRMYLYASARGPAVGRDFLAYAVSDRAQPAIAGAGFVNLAPLTAEPSEDAAQIAAAGESLPAELRAIAGPEVARFREAVRGARRLSITFRFEAGRTDLDPRAEADIGRLVRWARMAGNAGKQVVLLGHASVDGAYAANLALARARAQSVAARVTAAGVPVGQVESVGPVSPVACAGGTGETDINRRVEVWVR